GETRQLCANCTASLFGAAKTVAAWTLIGVIGSRLRPRPRYSRRAMAQFTRLERADLEAIARRFDLGALVASEALWAGTVNSNFRLETARGTFFARVNEGKREDEVRYEAELVQHLAARGVATPRACTDGGGAPFAGFGFGLVTVFPW